MRTGFCVALATLLAGGLSQRARGAEFFPDPGLEQGLTPWAVARGDDNTVSADPVVGTLTLDARRSGGVSLVSQPFPVPGMARVEFSAEFRRLSGENFSVMVAWYDTDDRQLAYEFVSMGRLVGSDWMPYRIEATIPEAATQGRVHIDLPGGAGAVFRRVSVRQIPSRGPDLSIDLLASSLPLSGAGAQLVVRLENRGEEVLDDLVAEVELPVGVEADAVALTFAAGRLGFGEHARRTLALRGYPESGPAAEIRCRVRGRTATGPVEFTAATPVPVTVADERTVPTVDLSAPRVPASRVKLGCYYFPVTLDWDRNGWGVRPVDSLEPRLGYYDEALAEVADWHVRWAAEHGIRFFVFDWYYNQGLDYLNDALEKGFLKSRFRDSMEFCLDWCNEGHCGQFKPVVFTHDALASFITVLCERYFPYPNYLRVDGRPVVIIHVPVKIANAHGGWAGCHEALERMRAIVRAHGYPGVYFVALQNNTPYLLPYAEGGFDAVTAYAYGFRDVPWSRETRSLSYEALIPRHRECFQIARDEAHAQGLAYIPSAWVGWDDAARSHEKAVRTEGNTPAAFRRMLELLPDAVEPDTRLALFESWNEWGEGGHAEPGKQYGFGRLQAVRDVLTDARGPYAVPVPPAADIARFDTAVTWREVHNLYLERYARNLGLDRELVLGFESSSDLSLRAVSGVADTRIEGGALCVDATSADPVLVGPPFLALRAESVTRLRVDLTVESGEAAQLFWQTATDTDWDEARSVRIPLSADGSMHSYTIDLSGIKAWTGVVTGLRFDPADSSGPIRIHHFECR
jgi:hypothetical protein